jgi:UDP-N-acetylmuramyl pentapeptide phosphotransferase/UDP-N-acetylglucosamine-1-phosphate transferase
MHALPFAVALIAAAAMARPLLRAMREEGHVRGNYRGRPLPFPFGVLVPCAALSALVPLVLLQRLTPAGVLHPEIVAIALYALGTSLLGLIDDELAGDARGVRGHLAATLRGELTTGTLKAFGSVGLALLAAQQLESSDGRWLLAAAVLVLATHVFNLLDLRPGRSFKALAVLGTSLTAGTGQLRPLWALGPFAAPALVAGLYDLREQAMLGDTGAGLLGALAGLWLVMALSQTGQLIALGALAAVSVVGEARSISTLLERTPVLRELDSWGRPS